MNFFLTHPRIKNTLICLISGILLGLSFPPFKTWFFVYFGMLLLLYLMLSAERFRQAFLRGYFTLLVFNILTLYWIGGWSNNDKFLMMGGAATDIIHPLFLLVPLLIFYGIKKLYKRGLALILFPLIWTGFEYGHNNGDLSFPWIELGNTETYNIHRIQYAELVGVHGITFLICIITVLLYFLILKLVSGRWKIISKPVVISFVIIIMLILFPNFYSYNYLINTANYERYFSTGDSSKVIKTAVIQPNVNPFVKWSSNRDSLVNSYIDKLNKSLALNSDLIVLHETSVPYYFLEDYNAYNTQKYIDFVNSNNKLLLMGAPNIQYYPDPSTAPPETEVMSKSGRRYGVYNSAILLEPGQTKDEYQIHKKAKLVPFSEHAPFQRYLPFMKKFVSWGVGISSWNPGDSLIIFNLKYGKINTKFVTLICFESVFSDYVSESVKKGAEFLIIITNDGWWGNNGGPVQHEQFAVLRAVENRKWIVRAGQTGISCSIDPLGKIYDVIPYDTEGVTVRTIIANNDRTFYSQHGDMIGKISYYAEILSLILCIILYAYRKIHAKSIA